MIQQYLHTIGKYLSPSQKEEVLVEIEAHLYDFLEQQFGEKKYTNHEIEIAIRAMGHPKKVAESYTGMQRAVIGPAYFEAYWLTIKISTIGTAIGFIVSNWILHPDTIFPLEIFSTFITDLLPITLGIIGIVTLIFTTIQYYDPPITTGTENNWSLQILNKAPKPTQTIHRLEVIVETIFLSFFFVFFVEIVPFISSRSFINMDYFSPFIKWIYFLGSAPLLLHLYVLARGYWQTFTRILAIALEILTILFLAKLFMTPEILNFTILGASDNINLLTIWFQTSVYIAFAVVLLFTCLKIYKHIALIRKNSSNEKHHQMEW